MAFDEDYIVHRRQDIDAHYDGDLLSLEIPPEVLSRLPDDMIKKYHLLPIRLEGDTLVIATDSVQALLHKPQIARRAQCDYVRFLDADSDNLKMAILKNYGIESYRKGSGTAAQEYVVDPDAAKEKLLLEDMLQHAAEEEASDIHLLPFSGGVYVHFRINGHMRDYTERYGFTAAQAARLANLVKQKDDSGKAHPDFNNMPDGGSFHISHGDEDVFIRFATVPVGAQGDKLQKVNLRLLPQNFKRKSLDQIGYAPVDLAAIKQALYKYPTGLFLNSGPVGSGKTTSLYAQMRYVCDMAGEPLNTMTIDDPIEIREERFTQIQVHHASAGAANLTAQTILKTCLRSDPDMFLYSEIRDKEDAKVALEASTTGHRVFSTIHAANCVKTIMRLLGLEVSRILLLSEIRMIISQRLVSVLCPYCSKPHTLTEQEKSILTPDEIAYLSGPNSNLKERGRPEDWKSCDYCSQGVTDRTALAEYVIFDNTLRDALLTEQGFQTVAKILSDHNFTSMWEKGLILAARGKVALDEIISVVGKED